MFRLVFTLLLAWAVSACATSPAASGEDLFSHTRVMEGVYEYIDGDVFIYSCGGTTCIDTLIRDTFLDANAVKLNGSKITIEVRRVVACDMQLSSQVACVRSGDGTALKIHRWIKPNSDK